MPAEATWFGPADRPLAGWLHVPDDGTVRGGVVICPPLGLEYVTSHRALRTVAELLAVRGFAALRFDYDGTGDSAGDPDDPGRVAAAFAGIGAALDEMRDTVGDVPIAVVGLRMGATLAAVRLADPGAAAVRADALVLWDPCRSGRAFLRQQRSLGLVVGCRDPGDGGVDAPGFRYSPSTVQDLGSLDLSALAPIPLPNVLVLTRPGQDAPASLSAATSETVAGMPEMLDVPSPYSVVATEAVQRLVGWLDDTLPARRVRANPRWRVEAALADGVLERHLRVGPLGLAAVETAPVAAAPARRSVLLLNNAAEHHMGPVRLWTELARAWASQGVRSVRFDLPGIGDSPTRPGEDDDLMYTPYEEQDVLDVVASGVVGADPVLAGLCSGAYQALRVGAALPAVSVVAVNIATTLPLGPRRIGTDDDLDIARGWPRRVLRLVGARTAGRGLMRVLEAATADASGPWWRLLVAARVVVSPGGGLPRLAGRDVTLICGTEDAAGYLTRGRRDLERARAAGLEFVAVEDLDHVPMPARQRHVLKGLLTEQVLRRTLTAARSGPVTSR